MVIKWQLMTIMAILSFYVTWRRLFFGSPLEASEVRGILQICPYKGPRVVQLINRLMQLVNRKMQVIVEKMLLILVID